jgi:succinate dehydrogenase/fumarate reductase flavoprotein subunit
MLTTESITTDVLVIGSGIAGMIAAIEAKKGGAAVALVSKGGLKAEEKKEYLVMTPNQANT